VAYKKKLKKAIPESPFWARLPNRTSEIAMLIENNGIPFASCLGILAEENENERQAVNESYLISNHCGFNRSCPRRHHQH